jgi:hypothetical protein
VTIVQATFLFIYSFVPLKEIKMEQITFDTLPAAVASLSEDVTFIKSLLLQHSQSQQPEERWLNIEQFCEYHPAKPSVATVYSWTSKKEVPFHKRGKQIYFLKSQIDSWLKAGRRKTSAEISAQADTLISKKQLRA